MTGNDEDSAPAEPQALRGDDAVALWKQGRDAWNAWIDDNPGAGIDFTGVDFSTHRTDGRSISFAEFRFGDGDIFFDDAKFGDGSVSFRGATFGDGDVSFWSVAFGEGNVSFENASFGDGMVSFLSTNFGDGHLDFHNAVFGTGRISLGGTCVQNIFFKPKTLKSVSLHCPSMIIKGAASFDLSTAIVQLKNLSFRNAILEGSLTLSGTLPAPPDLRGTKTVHHIELSALRATLRREVPRAAWPPALSRVAPDREDAARFRRLKEIAEANRDHAAALRFAADENRAKRWHETGWFASVLDMAFSGFSDYGQSVWRPVAGLVALTMLSAVFFKKIAATGDWGDAVSLAAGNAFAFLPQSRTVRDDALDNLFWTDPGTWIDLAMLGQAALSFVFLFLIGLGLRNRFRL